MGSRTGRARQRGRRAALRLGLALAALLVAQATVIVAGKTPTALASGPYDNFAQAGEWTQQEGSMNVDMAGATLESGERDPCTGGTTVNPDIVGTRWFRITVAYSGILDVAPLDTSEFSCLAIYEEPAGVGSPAAVTAAHYCFDGWEGPECGGPTAGTVVTIRRNYYVQFGVSSAASGSHTLSWSAPDPPLPPTISGNNTVVVNYTGTEQRWRVPPGVQLVRVDAFGAQGGGGAKGGSVHATIPVTPGDTLYLQVGGRPYVSGQTVVPGYNGGGRGGASGTTLAGGGATDVRVGPYLSQRVMVAGGGGGAGRNDFGVGGPASGVGGGDGGAGGGLTGSGGGQGNGTCTGRGGGGGSQIAGGAGGQSGCSYIPSRPNGFPGTLGEGGRGGGTTWGPGGGGGGGYYGGGGGAGGSGYPYRAGGGGGGGSSFVVPAAAGVIQAQGVRDGDGVLVITPTHVGGPLGSVEVTADKYGCAQHSLGEPVNTSTGNFWHRFVDFAIPGRGPGLGLSRVYNSINANQDGPFGWGWSNSLGLRLELDPVSGGAVVHEEQGAQVVFEMNGMPYFYKTAPRNQAFLVHNEVDGSFTYTRRATEIFDFDSSGRLIAIRDRNGYSTTLAYSGNQLATATDSAGRTLTFSYSNGRITGVADSASPPRTLSFTYDGAGNLATATDINGGITSFTYDGSHRVLTMRFPRHHGDTTTEPPPVITNHYDAQGRVDWQSDELGRTTSLNYTAVPDSTLITDPKGNQSLDTFAAGVLVAQTRGYGTAQASTMYRSYDPVSLGCTRITDPNGGLWLSAFDAAGNRTSVTDPLGRVTTATYNGLNLPTSITDANGVTTTMTYDAAGNLTSTSTPLVGAVPATNRTTALHYHQNGNPNNGEVTSMTDPDGKIWTFGYDNYGLLDSVTDPLGHESTSTFDSVGRMLSSTSPRGNEPGATAEDFTTHYGFDPDGLVTSITDPLDKTSSRQYDANRNLESSTDAEGNETTYEYNAADELTVVHRPDTTTMAYDYHPDGSLWRQIDGDEQETEYQYDAQGRVTTVTDPLNRTTTYGYDPAGNMVTKADPGGTCPAWPITYPPTMAANAGCTVNRYNAANELVGIDYSDPDTPDVALSYDDLGRRATMADATGTSTWAYDSLGRLTSSSTTGTGLPGGSQATTYGYDLRGNVTTIRYPGLNTDLTRTFDNAGRLDEIRDWNNEIIGNFDYDADGNLIESTLGNDVIDDAEYDHAGRLEAMGSTSGSDIIAAFDYTRDNNGQVESTSSAGARHLGLDDHSYAYNALNQLEGLDSDSSAFDHDPADNLIERHRGRTMAHDEANQLESVSVDLPVTYWGGVPGDKLLPADYGGDGSADLGAYRPSEANWYLKDSATAGETGIHWGQSTDVAVPGDYDGDGTDDMAVYRPVYSAWYVRYSGGGPDLGAAWGIPGDIPVPSDYDGDGRADLAVYRPSNGAWFIKHADDGAESSASWGVADDIAVPDDYDGDGRADLAVYRPSNGAWFIKHADDGAESSASWGVAGDIPVPADYDGDGRADLAVYRPSNGAWFIKHADDGAESAAAWGIPGDEAVPDDYDGDGKADLAVYRPTSGAWFFRYSSDSSEASAAWGLAGDIAVPDDYDGDGLADLAVYRPSANVWFFRYSSDQSEDGISWGHPGDIAVPADYDGDSRTDLATFRPSNTAWYIKYSDDGAESSTVWGATGDIPVPADYDGDGVTDVATFRPSTNIWHVRQSSDQYEYGTYWGASGDIPVPADYDGDGKADLATFRPASGTWYVTYSTGAPNASIGWGTQGDIPVPGDYDGDNKADIAVWRPAAGTWYVTYSSGAPFTATGWGVPGDVPVPADYDGDTKTDIAIYRPTAGLWYRLASAEATFAHDSRGNRITTTRGDTNTAWNYGYDQANRMKSAPGSTYTYRGDGLRMAKDPGVPTTFAWDESGSMPMLLSEKTSAGTTRYIYGPTGSPIARVDNNGTLYYHHDQLGSIRAITNNDGDTVGTATYDPYGTRTHHSGITTPFGFAGEYTDTETGFQYLRNRYYDPATGQFLTRDPIAALTQEPYGYVGGNPLNYADPLGLCRVGPFQTGIIENPDNGCKPAEWLRMYADDISTYSGILSVVCAAAAYAPCSLIASSGSLLASGVHTVVMCVDWDIYCINAIEAFNLNAVTAGVGQGVSKLVNVAGKELKTVARVLGFTNVGVLERATSQLLNTKERPKQAKC